MNNNTVLNKIWQILYPLLLYFFMDVIIVWAVEQITGANRAGDPSSVSSGNAMSVATVVFMAISIPLFYFLIYRKDYNIASDWVYRRPWYFILIAVLGALASHGLSSIVSITIPDNIIGTYGEIQNNVFAASPVLVVLQTAILAPLSEEILFRGILYKRLGRIFGGFWAPALISSALFGIYHLNLAQGVFAFLFGLLICAVYYRIQNLWACIALHIGGNLTSVILVYAGFKYPSPALYYIMTAVTLAGSWAIYFFMIRRVKAD